MNRIINWIKHEYRIFKKIDAPTEKDSKIASDILWFSFPIFVLFMIGIMLIFFKVLEYFNIDPNGSLGQTFGPIFMILFMSIFIIPLMYLQSLNSDNKEQKLEDPGYRSNLRKELVAKVEELRKLHGSDYNGEDIADLLDEIEWIDAYDHPIIWKAEDYGEEDDENDDEGDYDEAKDDF